MNLLGVLGKIRKVLGAVTDALLIGRQKGWWDEGDGPRFPDSKQGPR